MADECISFFDALVGSTLYYPVVVGLLVTAVVYIRIYFAAQRHKNQIHVLQVQQAAENNEIVLGNCR